MEIFYVMKHGSTVKAVISEAERSQLERSGYELMGKTRAYSEDKAIEWFNEQKDNSNYGALKAVSLTLFLFTLVGCIVLGIFSFSAFYRGRGAEGIMFFFSGILSLLIGLLVYLGIKAIIDIANKLNENY